jgi:hypothetical protein
MENLRGRDHTEGRERERERGVDYDKVLNYASSNEAVLWEWRYSSTFFTSALDGGEW